ncbi:transcription factor IBH1-like 1 [Brachypodium distachyon]|uniref:IBH1-like N-terminal domain-containing protein n=1 Tax=Brachypodium distachyon TaxID=15368 RepID=A0A0Q3H2Q1_BRADI|nr:transcription factor IBH1-like 1 [Brachypodium distachyon]KQK16869.1 hypothetical protein BRADI_1g31161v3 [Brachypodium distachyon]|eukprot:XP_003560375.1 transcription factor IBH1-like 1 [Brachypodium distachyon]
MQGPNTSTSSTKSFKQVFLKNLLHSLACLHAHTSTTAMSVHDRKLAVKSAADVAMAAARSSSGAGDVGAARWPKAILFSASGACKARRSCRRCRRWKRSSASGANGVAVDDDVVARRMLRKKAMALREVIPGGRDAADMEDEASLLKEAMDYAVHLRAQVDVLRRVSEVAAVQRSG